MTATKTTRTRARLGRRPGRFIAAAVTVGVASTAIVAAGGGTAGAAELPQAQSVGRFLDGSAGGSPIQKLADLHDARAVAPGRTSDQNGFDLTALGALDIPLTDAISIPAKPAADAGVVNQVATANVNGKSLGASGAVGDDGGVSVGDDNDGAPAFATVNLSSDALGSIPIPGLPSVPGLPTGLPSGNLAALGGVTATIGAVYAQVGTKVGGKIVTPSSGTATVKLQAGSPALGALLSQLKGLLNPEVLADALSAIPGLDAVLALLPNGSDLTKCALTAPSVNDISLAGGGVVVDVANATLTIDLRQLIKKLLDKDISDLSTSNFDMISFLVTNLPKILSTGLSDLVTSITDPLENQFKACTALLGPLGDAADTVLGLLDTGKTTILGAIDGLSDQFSSAATAPLGQLADALKSLVDIGLNVQSGPGKEPNDKTYPFESNLKATPAQNTPVVKDQTLVRAIEVQLLDVGGLPGAGGLLPGGIGELPIPGGIGTNSASTHKLTGGGAANAVRPLALAPGDGLINLALGNAAAGPSNAPAPQPASSTPNSSVPGTNIPIGVPAGAAASNGGSPVLPLIVLLLGLTILGGGYLTYRTRGKFMP